MQPFAAPRARALHAGLKTGFAGWWGCGNVCSFHIAVGSLPGQDFMGFLHLGWDTATQEGPDEPLSALSPAWEEAGR